MGQAEPAAVAFGYEPRMQIVYADDLSTDRDRGEIAEAQQAAADMTGQLQLDPDLWQARTLELGQDLQPQRMQRQRFHARLRRDDRQVETLRERMRLGNQQIQRKRDLPRVSGHAVRLQRQKIAVYRPFAARIGTVPGGGAGRGGHAFGSNAGPARGRRSGSGHAR